MNRNAAINYLRRKNGYGPSPQVVNSELGILHQALVEIHLECQQKGIEVPPQVRENGIKVFKDIMAGKTTPEIVEAARIKGQLA